MAATKKQSSKKEQITEERIIALYMDSLMTSDDLTKNIYVFCKNNGLEESDFYSFFGSFENLRQMIWLKFFENAIGTIRAEASYDTYSDKNKLLTLFYTLFEILTLNRSYILATLQGEKYNLKNLKDLILMRTEVKKFISEIVDQNGKQEIEKLQKIKSSLFAEGAWIQFLFILKFWMEDNSKGFEKTDIVIEKSVNSAVDLFDTKPVESLIDLGKFLWKEHHMKA